MAFVNKLIISILALSNAKAALVCTPSFALNSPMQVYALKTKRILPEPTIASLCMNHFPHRPHNVMHRPQTILTRP